MLKQAVFALLLLLPAGYAIEPGAKVVIVYYGYSDGVFGPITRQALAQWQAGQGLYVSGYLDATSRARYSELMGNYSIPTYGVVSGYTGIYSGSNFNSIASPEAQRAQDKMWEALRMIGNAWDEVDNTNRNTSSAKKDLEDAQDDLRDAAREFFANGDYEDAYDLAVDAFENAEDAFDKVDGGSGTRADADDAIDDANDAINDAEDEIDDADRRGRDVRDAEDKLDDAKDKLDDAEEQFDDKDYDDAEDLANDAEDLAQDAIDAID